MFVYYLLGKSLLELFSMKGKILTSVLLLGLTYAREGSEAIITDITEIPHDTPQPKPQIEIIQDTLDQTQQPIDELGAFEKELEDEDEIDKEESASGRS